jgi:oligopeptide/dipeptide ABC transporter ATP-binding protein
MATTVAPLLQVRDLEIAFTRENETITAVHGISFDVNEGEVMALVGESGCGKSTVVLSLLNLLPPAGRIAAGSIRFRRSDGTVIDIATTPKYGEAIRALRGREIAMIFQEAAAALDPVYTIGFQIAESLRANTDLPRSRIGAAVVDLLRRVGIPSPAVRAKSYAFEQSGGMNQRSMIAMALAAGPRLLICDEPTTALDVTIQGQILELIERIKTESGNAIIFITHDLAVVAEIADRIAVMYLGRQVEVGSKAAIFNEALHPYTRGLFASVPVLGEKRKTLVPIPGEVPSSSRGIRGCPFAARCGSALACCSETPPPRIEPKPGHSVECWLYAEDRP